MIDRLGKSLSPYLASSILQLFVCFRLWGEHGQAKLEISSVCLINATCLGTEILKGLVLPGVGAFMIVDSNIVTEEDIGSK